MGEISLGEAVFGTLLAGGSALASRGSRPSPPAPLPPPPPPPVMPVPDDEAAKRARRRQIATAQNRSGRQSTLLTDQTYASGSETLGGG